MSEMTQEELARAVAAELGSDVADETEKRLRGETSRAFGVAESAAVGALVAQTAQLAIQFYQIYKDRASLVKELEAKAPTHSKVDEAKRRGIIGRFADRLTGVA